MQIENEFEVPAPIDDVWTYMQDVPRVTPCMPGAELTETISDNKFKGRVKTSMGPVSLTFNGEAEITQRDAGSKRMVVNASGSEEKGKGQASMTLTATLHSAGSGTKVKVVQDLQMSGAAAQFGRGMIQDVSGVLMQQFADCLKDDIGRYQRGEGPSGKGAKPASGMAIGVQSTKAGVKRIGKKMFGGDK